MCLVDPKFRQKLRDSWQPLEVCYRIPGYRPIEYTNFVRLSEDHDDTRSGTYLAISGPAVERIGELLGAPLGSVPVGTGRNEFAHAMIERGRILKDIRVNQDAVREYGREVRKLLNQLRRIEPDALSLDEVVDSFSGPKREMYLKCQRCFEKEGMGRIVFKGFPKSGEGQKDPNKPRPRQIITQCSKAPISGEFGQRPLMIPVMVELTVRKPQQAAMHKVFQQGWCPLFAQGANPDQKAEVIYEAVNVRGLEGKAMDMVAFDGSTRVSADIERQEFERQIRAAKPPYWKEIVRVLRAQGKAVVSHKGDVFGYGSARQSGTGGTSVGNKIVVVAALRYALRISKRKEKIYLYCDGDDTLIFASPEDWKTIGDDWLQRMADLGHEVKIEKIFKTAEEAQFCRAKPLVVGERYTMVKDPVDALKKVFNITRHVRGNCLRDYLTTYSEGCRVLWAGVPVLHSVHKLFATGGKINKNLLAPSGLEYMIKSRTFDKYNIPVTLESRYEMERACGIGIATQLEIEDILESMAETTVKGFLDFIVEARSGQRT